MVKMSKLVSFIFSFNFFLIFFLLSFISILLSNKSHFFDQIEKYYLQKNISIFLQYISYNNKSFENSYLLYFIS